MTLVELLERNARELPDKTAVAFHTRRINYRELNDTVNKVSCALLDMGIKKGDRVGFMLPRIPEIVEGFLAVAKVQGIAAPINFELPAEKISAILKNIGPRCLIVHASFLELARKSIPRDSQIPVIAVGETAEKCLLWDEILKREKADNHGFNIKNDDIVYLNYTSGFAGDSKGAITTHANIYYNTIASVDALGLTPDDVHLCMFAPFAHPHELFARPLYLGGTMVLVDKIYPKSLAEAISNNKVTCMMGLAPMYENLLDVLEHKTYDLSSIRIPESGGMHTRLEIIDRFRQKVGVPIIPVWGSTETTGIAIANRPGKNILPGSAGKSCVSYEVKVVDKDDAEVPPGEIGEMLFKGPAVVQGYYKDVVNNEVCFKNGWYYSGDLAKRDEEGNLYFVGTKNGMMKVAGLKVYPLEIELVLMEHPDIREAAVISATDRIRGEVPKAIIATNNGRVLTEKEILGFCRERLAHYKVPRIIEIRDSLPKLGSG
ncbi:MAG: AMP-binding protein, partial [Candidatus Omnitrophica bacterium]|nr:AMP-binding protein [Candidatus Omnitrophota bacterium]